MKAPGHVIALIQDDIASVGRLRRAFSEAGYDGTFRVLRNGEDARRFLSDGARAGRPRVPRPFLLVCDAVLPGMSGLDLRSWMRERPALEGIPFVVLASSPRAEDFERATALGVQAFILLPVDDAELVRAVRPLLAGAANGSGADAPRPALKRIRVGSSSENTEIRSQRRYRVRIGSDWHEGSFTKYWFGWKFEGGGSDGLQLNLIDEVFEILRPFPRTGA